MNFKASDRWHFFTYKVCVTGLITPRLFKKAFFSTKCYKPKKGKN